MEVILQNVRCFSNRHSIRLRPLTLVTGENSSGKTTLLATISAIVRSYEFPIRPLFNEPPFSLGNFENIATYKGGKYGRADFFKIGFSDKVDRFGDTQVVGTYTNDRGTPFLSEFSVKSTDLDCELKYAEDKIEIRGTFREQGHDQPTKLHIDLPLTGVTDLPRHSWIGAVLRGAQSSNQVPKNLQEVYFRIYRLVDMSFSSGRGSEAIAPLRTKPLRTYDQSKLAYSADGDHIPYTLSRLFDEAKHDDSAAANIRAMIRFGKDSGLFRDMKVKFLGKNVSDPFQIMVSVSGRPANLVDVGYGVSQSLPIITQAITSPKKGLLLIQQPEVHLHPKAQAAIGTFFAELVATKRRQFVIETHSDYIVDRVRQAVADKTLKSEDVAILYLEPHPHTTVIHQLGVDDHGNLKDAPLGYREFFMREEMKMLQLSNDSSDSSEKAHT